MHAHIQFLAHVLLVFFFFNDTATTEIYTLSLHDALPISSPTATSPTRESGRLCGAGARRCAGISRDRKSTRLNSSHGYISYAVFCLKKKKSKHVRRLAYWRTIHGYPHTSLHTLY